MTRKVLVTGFGPFGDVVDNPAGHVATFLGTLSNEAVQVHTDILDVSYAGAEAAVKSLIEQYKPDVMLCFGAAVKRDVITAERFAVNVDDSTKPDNNGQHRSGNPIVADGPAGLAATIDVNGLIKTIDGIKASNHAGGYVCNHVFYTALYHAAALELPTKVGFIHLPMPKDRAALEAQQETAAHILHFCLTKG